MTTNRTYNVFTSLHSTDQPVKPNLFVAQVDATDNQRARKAAADALNTDPMYLTAQFADDPRAQGQRWATDKEFATLRWMAARYR